MKNAYCHAVLPTRIFAVPDAKQNLVPAVPHNTPQKPVQTEETGFETPRKTFKPLFEPGETAVKRHIHTTNRFEILRAALPEPAKEPSGIRQNHGPTIFTPSNHISISPHIHVSSDRETTPGHGHTIRKPSRVNNRKNSSPYNLRRKDGKRSCRKRKDKQKNNVPVTPLRVRPYVEVPPPPSKNERTRYLESSVSEIEEFPPLIRSHESCTPDRTFLVSDESHDTTKRKSEEDTNETPRDGVKLAKWEEFVSAVSEELREIAADCASSHRTTARRLSQLEDEEEEKLREDRNLRDVIEALKKAVKQGEDNAKLLDEATNRIEKAERRCAMLGQMVDRLEEAERRMGTLDQIGPDVLALIRRMEQMEFRATIARDEHDNLAQRHDHFTRLVAYDRDVDLLVLPASPSPRTLAAIARHWVSHIVDAARRLIPNATSNHVVAEIALSLAKCTSSVTAVAGILNIAEELVLLMHHDVEVMTSAQSAAARAALRLSMVLYPSIRSALISVALSPGLWTRGICTQEDAPSDLPRFIEDCVKKADIPGLVASAGEPFMGHSNSARDRWLPLVHWHRVVEVLYHSVSPVDYS